MSQFYFPNLNISVREQFCHQLNFFDLGYRHAKKLQLIDSAACRKLRLKLAEMNLIDFCIKKEKKYALLDFNAVVLLLIFCMRYLNFLFEKAFLLLTQVDLK